MLWLLTHSLVCWFPDVGWYLWYLRPLVCRPPLTWDVIPSGGAWPHCAVVEFLRPLTGSFCRQTQRWRVDWSVLDLLHTHLSFVNHLEFQKYKCICDSDFFSIKTKNWLPGMYNTGKTNLSIFSVYNKLIIDYEF